jgi:membrane protein YqaA with SNARE-associated domain
MHKLITWLQSVAIPFLGPWGVFLAAFLDASFLSLPEINDLMVVAAAATDPRGVWLVAAMATLGSVAGCAALWWVGRRGGEALLLRRFGPGRVERVRRAFRRWDLLALAIPAMLPPPMPFKIFVIAAGVFGMPLGRFALTLLLARGLRYAFWGVLGAAYGVPAMAVLRRVDQWCVERTVPLLLGSAVVLVGAWAFVAWRRRATPVPRANEATESAMIAGD